VCPVLGRMVEAGGREVKEKEEVVGQQEFDVKNET
jgi:hypothetical protein